MGHNPIRSFDKIIDALSKLGHGARAVFASIHDMRSHKSIHESNTAARVIVVVPCLLYTAYMHALTHCSYIYPREARVHVDASPHAQSSDLGATRALAWARASTSGSIYISLALPNNYLDL